MIAKRLRFESEHATEFVDITDRLRQEVLRSGMRMGRLHLQSLHTTLGLTVNENEPLLLRDFQSLLERVVPANAGYEHDDFARRYDVALDEPVNGHAHCRQLLLTGFATVLVEDGELVLGRWQSVFAVELDGPRHRELALQLDGEFSPPRSPARSGLHLPARREGLPKFTSPLAGEVGAQRRVGANPKHPPRRGTAGSGLARTAGAPG